MDETATAALRALLPADLIGAAADKAAQPKPAIAPPLTVLLVDDDGLVRELTAATLEGYGFRVEEADCGRAALALVEAGAAIDLMLVDFEMPGMNGVSVCQEVLRRRPDLPVLFLTGYAHAAALNGIPADRIIAKPWRGDDLVRRVRAALPTAEPDALSA